MKNITQHLLHACSLGGRTTFIIEHFPSNKYIINQIIQLMIPTIIMNGVSLLTILRSSHLKPKLCYFQILIQSTSDLGFGMISLPLYTPSLVQVNCWVLQIV